MFIFSIKKYQDATAKSHDHSFEVLQKSKIGNFSVVTLRAVASNRASILKVLLFFQNGMNRKYPLVRPSFTVFCQILPRKLKRRLVPSSRIETNGK